MKYLKILFVLLVGFSASQVSGQVVDATDQTDTTKQLYLVTKTDGVQFYGYIVSDDGREVLLMTKSIGKIYISKGDIASIVKVSDTETEKIESGAYSDYRNEGPFTTRYYLTTNALPIKKGENYAMIHLYGPEVHFAVSDNLSIGVMSSWIASPIAIATKYSFDSKTDNHFALGTIVGSSGFLMNGSGLGGLHFATYTRGGRKSNLSFSGGYGWTVLGSQWRKYYGREYQVRGESAYNTASKNTLTKLIGEPYSTEMKRPFTGAGVFGISGIAPVGKKASFIFDGMAVIAPRYQTTLVATQLVKDIEYPIYDGTTKVGDFTVDKFEIEQSGIKPTVLIMPGMRFNQAHNKAFQVVLAGVITTGTSGEVFTFPVPMVSWLRTF